MKEPAKTLLTTRHGIIAAWQSELLGEDVYVTFRPEDDSSDAESGVYAFCGLLVPERVLVLRKSETLLFVPLEWVQSWVVRSQHDRTNVFDRLQCANQTTAQN